MACSKISDKISGNQKDDTKIEEEKRMRLFERVNTKIRSNPWDSPELNLLESPMKPSSVSADKVQVRGRGWIPKNKTMDHFESAFFRPVSPETHYSEDLELLDEKCSEDEDRKNYRILQVPAGLFMCKFSNLVFEMEGKVKVLYRIVSWNCCNLDGLGQKQPAGPLYNIKCPEGSIHRLHLPHCETRKHMGKLTVAHVTDDNVEIIQPLKVTNTHVIIDIQSLSLFGILRELLFQAHPIRAQVLLFYQRGMNKLYIHLVPGNVPVEEVQKRHETNTTYIMTSSKCNLTPGRIYIPCCKATECDYVSQPENETFDYEYGPNYHPTFEVLLSTEVKQVTLSLLDEKGKLVWKPRVVLLKGTVRTPPRLDTVTGADFVDKHSEKLIQRVLSVMEIADYLKGKEMISNEMYSNIKAKATQQDKMRELYTCLDSGGRSVKAEFYKILREKEPFIVDDLESGSSLELRTPLSI